MSEFESLVKEIEGAYQRLGHSMGWRLLYGPRATLAPHSRLAFVGLDPGGHQYYPPAPSVEEGNAFRAVIEPWGPHGGESPLQSQIRVLYEALAGRLGATRSWEALMDETLAANLCPFRCPPRGWKALPNRDATIEFSRHLWWRIFGVVQPRAVVCCGKVVGAHLGDVLRRRGCRRLPNVEKRAIGWGAWTYKLERYRSPRATVLLVHLPHLSFQIFGPARPHLADEIAEPIAAALKGQERQE